MDFHVGGRKNRQDLLFKYSCFSIFGRVSVINAISLASAANLSSAEPEVVILGLRLKDQGYLPSQ